MLFQRQEKTVLTPKHVGACSPLPLPFPPRCSGRQDCTALCTLLHCGKEGVREVYDVSHVPEPFGAGTKNQQLYWCPGGSRAMGMRRHRLQTSGDKDRAEEKTGFLFQLLASGSVYARAQRRGHGIFPAWLWPGRAGEGSVTIRLIPPHTLLLSSQSLLRKGEKRGEKTKADGGSQIPSFCMSS